MLALIKGSHPMGDFRQLAKVSSVSQSPFSASVCTLIHQKCLKRDIVQQKKRQSQAADLSLTPKERLKSSAAF